MNSQLLVRGLALLLSATTVVVLSNTTYFESKFSMMERGLACLAVALIFMWFTANHKPIFLPTFLVGLTIVSGMSIANYLQIYRVQDFIGYASAFLTAAIYISILDKKLLINSIAAGFSILVTWSLVLIGNGTESWNLYGQYQGPFVHYNILGFTMLLAIPSFLFIKTQNLAFTFALRLSLLSCAVYLIDISESRTSFVSAIIVIAAYLIWLSFTKSQILGWVLVGLSLVLSVALLLNSSSILKLLGKDNSLTGRTKIWESLLEHFGDRPLTGFGWSRLFTPDSPISSIASSETGFFVSHSHNDLLHWYITTGTLGALFVISNIFVTVFLALKSPSRKSYWGAWVLISILALTISGTTEISSFQVQGWYVLSLISVIAVKEAYNQEKPINRVVGVRLSPVNFS